MKPYYLIIYITFGILPSLVWLFYYLKKDLHPEPKKMITKIFICGFLVTIPVFIVQIILSYFLNKVQSFALFAQLPILTEILKWFLVIAFTEEFFKYLVVRKFVFSSSELDEPTDLIIYMIVSALGFAALENILYLFSPIESIISFNQIIQTTLVITFVRFVGATLLHALSSGLLGYFLAIGFYKGNRLKMTLLGMFTATLLHGSYNFSIMTIKNPLVFLIPTMIILVLFGFILRAFAKLKKIKDVCEV